MTLVNEDLMQMRVKLTVAQIESIVVPLAVVAFSVGLLAGYGRTGTDMLACLLWWAVTLFYTRLLDRRVDRLTMAYRIAVLGLHRHSESPDA